jgi:hypothetical protein
MKYFNDEIKKILDKLKKRQNFSFSKFADGEWAMIKGHQLNNSEFEYLPDKDEIYRQKLIESFIYKDDGYFVGISCPCCQGDEHYNMYKFSNQNDENITFANLFVNSNYNFFKEFFIEEFKNWKIHLVAHETSNVENLPFKVEKFYPVSDSAWKNNYDLIDEIKKENLSGKLFLFSCGPFGNMLSHQLWENNKNNTYMDVGSTLNFWTNAKGFQRYYMFGGQYSELVCVWGDNPINLKQEI